MIELVKENLSFVSGVIAIILSIVSFVENRMRDHW